MKNKLLLLVLALAGSSAVLPPQVSAAGYTSAEFTRLYNEVRVIKENAAPKDASVGQKIDVVTSVATGAGSRAELKFPDNSLTRLGANSRFTLRGDKRTLDLDQGVMLLQVPKQMGGAKVRTAAVTAAVTGTTVMFEYLPGGFVKLIVIEGQVDLYLNSDPSKFTTVLAGQMIIMPADSKVLPVPVDVDLAVLLKTSKLISGDDQGMPNFMEVADALKKQQKELKKGDLVATNLVLPGRGTLVTLTNDTYLNLFKHVQVKDSDPPAPGGGPAGPGTPGGLPPGDTGLPPGEDPPEPFYGFLPLISGTTVLNHHSTIVTNPHVTAYNSGAGGTITSEGMVYDATIESPFTYFGFGRILPVEHALFQPYLESKGSGKWAAFKFDSLLINGTPDFDYPSWWGGIRNVILSADGEIRLAKDNSYGPGNDAVSYEQSLNLWYSGLNSLVLFSNEGSVSLEKYFAIYGGWVDVSLVGAGATSNVNLLGEVAILGDLLLSAGQDINIEHSVSARNIDGRAGRDINIKGRTSSGPSYYGYGYGYGYTPAKKVTATENLILSARGNINITDSSQLKVLSSWWDHDALLRLESLEGNINVLDSSLEARNIEIEAYGLNGIITIDGAHISAGDVLKVSAIGQNGELKIGNSYLNGSQVVRLYATGTNGRVHFVGHTTIEGKYISIAGATVEIDKYKVVTLKPGYGKVPIVYTDTAKYNDAGGLYGKFKRGYNATPSAVTTKTFGERPMPE